MAQQRPYRCARRRGILASPVGKEVCRSDSGIVGFLIVNWMTTQHAALLMGDSPRLGRALSRCLGWGRFYAPWKWVVWAWS